MPSGHICVMDQALGNLVWPQSWPALSRRLDQRPPEVPSSLNFPMTLFLPPVHSLSNFYVCHVMLCYSMSYYISPVAAVLYFLSSLSFCLSFYIFQSFFMMGGELVKNPRVSVTCITFSMARVFHTDLLSTPAGWLAANIEFGSLQAMSWVLLSYLCQECKAKLCLWKETQLPKLCSEWLSCPNSTCSHRQCSCRQLTWRPAQRQTV